MVPWIANVCFYFLVDFPRSACRASRRFARKWWYSHYQ